MIVNNSRMYTDIEYKYNSQSDCKAGGSAETATDRMEEEWLNILCGISERIPRNLWIEGC